MKKVKRILVSNLKIDPEKDQVCITNMKGTPIITMIGMNITTILDKFSGIEITGNEVRMLPPFENEGDEEVEEMIINIVECIKFQLASDRVINEKAYLEMLKLSIEKCFDEF